MATRGMGPQYPKLSYIRMKLYCTVWRDPYCTRFLYTDRTEGTESGSADDVRQLLQRKRLQDRLHLVHGKSKPLKTERNDVKPKPKPKCVLEKATR